jgi:hypothetical protein
MRKNGSKQNMKDLAKQILVLGLVLTAVATHAQSSQDTLSRVDRKLNNSPFLRNFFNSLELRQSFGSAGARNAPVRFQLTIPKDEKSSFLIDGGIGIPVVDLAIGNNLNMNGKVIGEYHRNTLIDEEQHTWQTGLTSTFRTKIKQSNSGATFSQLYFTPTIKYSRNLIDTANSLLFTVDFIPFRSSEKGVNLNTYTIKGSRRLIHLLSLVPGLEFQNNFSAAVAAHNGSILRPLFKFQYLLAGNKRRMPEVNMISPEKTWEASVDYTVRYAIVNSTLTNEKFSDLLRTGVDYYFLTKPVSISFGFSFNYGSDPLQGLKKQHFYLATLSLQK